MSSTRKRYVAYARGGSRRLHPGADAMVDITEPLHDRAASQGALFDDWAPPTMSWPGPRGISQVGRFAFWSVTGAAEGADLSGDNRLAVHVGSGPLVAVAMYLPLDGRPPSAPALYVDAFDVDQGRFLDADFATVASDPRLSAAANESGLVLTASADQVEAAANVENVPFLEWLQLPNPAETLDGDGLRAAATNVATAFACYRIAANPPPHLPGRLRYPAIAFQAGVCP